MTNQPIPRLPEDRHGTRCAGEVAASRNDVCGVGVAWDAKVSGSYQFCKGTKYTAAENTFITTQGIRILSGDLTEADEASAIIYENQINQIYSCSWGPSDNGIAMDAPPRVVADAFKEGIIKGRGGLGSLFVFATGNGGSNYDNW